MYIFIIGQKRHDRCINCRKIFVFLNPITIPFEIIFFSLKDKGGWIMSAILSSHMKKNIISVENSSANFFTKEESYILWKRLLFIIPSAIFFFFKSWAALKAHQQKFWTRLLQALPESTLISGPWWTRFAFGAVGAIANLPLLFCLILILRGT